MIRISSSELAKVFFELQEPQKMCRITFMSEICEKDADDDDDDDNNADTDAGNNTTLTTR